MALADLSDRSSVTAETDSSSTRADGGCSQTGHACTFLQPTLSDGDNLWCRHLFLARCVIKRHPLNPAHDRVIHFPSILRSSAHGDRSAPGAKKQLRLFIFSPHCLPSWLHTYFPPISLFQLHAPSNLSEEVEKSLRKKTKTPHAAFFFHRFKFALSGNTLTQMCMWRTKGWILIIYTRLNSTCVQKGHECDLWEITVMDMFTLYHSAIKTIDRKQQQWK